MYDPNAYDVEPRRKFRASDAGQFIVTLLLLISTGKLMYDGPDCPYLSAWNSVVFFGSLIWIVYLVITLVVQFRNEAMRNFLGYVDYLFVLFLGAVWIWDTILYDNKQVDTCETRWRLASRTFAIFGWIVLICIACVAFMFVIRLIHSKAAAGKPEVGSHHHGDYEMLDRSAI